MGLSARHVVLKPLSQAISMTYKRFASVDLTVTIVQDMPDWLRLELRYFQFTVIQGGKGVGTSPHGLSAGLPMQNGLEAVHGAPTVSAKPVLKLVWSCASDSSIS